MKTHAGWNYPDADDFMWREATSDGRYQATHLDVALRFVTDFFCAVDGGAHVGTWSKLLADRFHRVIAVEPAPDTYEALCANMQRFDCANVTCLNLAIGARTGWVSMALDGKPAAAKNTGGRHIEPGGEIRLETIDAWNLPSLGFLKLDVEGSEVDAIKGAALTITRCKPIVLWEDKGFCRRYGHKPDAPRTLLASLGYEHKARVSADEIWGPRS